MKNLIYLIVFIFAFPSAILFSQNYNWRLVDKNGGSNSASFIKDSTKYICGGLSYEGLVARFTKDGGRNWITAVIDSNPGIKSFPYIKNSINKIYWGKDNSALAISDMGYYYTTNDLINWKKSRIIHNQGYGEFQDADYNDGVVLVSYNYEVYRSYDLGLNWELFPTPNFGGNSQNTFVLSISIYDKDTYFITTDDQFITNKNGYKTTNAGIDWIEIPQIGNFSKVFFFNDFIGIGFTYTCPMCKPLRIFKINLNSSINEIFFDEDYYCNLIDTDAKNKDNIIALFGCEKITILKITNNQTKIEIDDSTFVSEPVINNNSLKFIDDKKLLSTKNDGTIYKFTDEEIGLRVGINIEKSSEIVLFPNPATDKIKVNFGNDKLQLESFIKYEIIDMDGKILISSQIENNEEIEVGFLQRGSYFIKLNNIITKFIKI